jgi:hypothetical protein
MAEYLSPGSMFHPQNITVAQMAMFTILYGKEIFMVKFTTAPRIQSEVAPTLLL